MLIRILFLAPLVCLVSFGQREVYVPNRPVTLIEALRSTLGQNPGIKLQEEQVRLDEGSLRAASGQFDTIVNAGMSQNHTNTPLTLLQEIQYAQLGILSSDLDANATTYTVSAQKLFRNGITAGPSINLTRNTDNLSTRTGLNQSQISFQIVLPFFRGRGRAAVDAQEMSSQTVVEASVHDANATVAQFLTNTASNYWNAVAALENLKIAKDSEERGAKYVRDVQTLIDADKVAKGEIYQLLANLEDRTGSRIAAEQGVISAQQSLAVAMGLKAEEILVSPDASEGLPDWPENSIPEISPGVVQKFVSTAMKRRPDVIAARLRRQAAGQILPAARNQLLPQLNLTLNAGYGGLLEGTGFGRPFGAPFNNVQGMNMYASLNFTFPPRNDLAIGQLTQAEASYRQAILNEADLKRNVASSVVTAATTLSNSVAALKKAKEAVANYRVALDQEQERFHLGMNALVDVLTMEDRLTTALSQEVSAHLNYALSIENLRLATGTVVDPDQRTHTVVRDTFIRPPAESELQ